MFMLKETGMCHSKIWVFDIKMILHQRQLRISKGRKSSSFLASKQEINSPFTKDRLLTAQRGLQSSLQTNLVKLTLIFLVTFFKKTIFYQ